MTEQEAQETAEAQAEAEKVWPIIPSGVTDSRDVPGLLRNRGAFVMGWIARAAWERPRVVAAPTAERNSAIADLEEHCQYHYGGSDPELFEKIDALRSQPVQVEVTDEMVKAASESLGIHRWKSMGVSSVECECGEIVKGADDLTGFPADVAFRNHLARAALTAALGGGDHAAE